MEFVQVGTDAVYPLGHTVTPFVHEAAGQVGPPEDEPPEDEPPEDEPPEDEPPEDEPPEDDPPEDDPPEELVVEELPLELVAQVVSRSKSGSRTFCKSENS